MNYPSCGKQRHIPSLPDADPAKRGQQFEHFVKQLRLAAGQVQ